VSLRPVEFAARDGFRLGGILYRPAQPNGRAVLVNAAVGVRQQYYAAFAAFLEERGFTVLTYDYRGIAASRHGPLRALPARIRDWAQLDAAAALDELARAAPDARLLVVGHSFGGNGLGLVPGIERLAGALFVGVQSGYWRHWSGIGRAGMWFLVHALLPGIASLFGYVPAALFGQGEDLPAGVAAEWASWCRDPHYAAGAVGPEGYASFRAPIRSYWIADDGYAPRAATEAILREYAAAPSEVVAVDPDDHGGRVIGHFGFFRERFRETLWRDAADWLAGLSDVPV
jgi:predicted alpha/beta hydrolase